MDKTAQASLRKSFLEFISNFKPTPKEDRSYPIQERCPDFEWAIAVSSDKQVIREHQNLLTSNIFETLRGTDLYPTTILFFIKRPGPIADMIIDEKTWWTMGMKVWLEVI